MATAEEIWLRRQLNGVCPLCDVTLGELQWTCKDCGRTYHESCFWRQATLDEWRGWIRRVMETDENVDDFDVVCAACRQAAGRTE
jgi:hypothetical protein